jgi:hypothetical protein
MVDPLGSRQAAPRRMLEKQHIMQGADIGIICGLGITRAAERCQGETLGGWDRSNYLPAGFHIPQRLPEIEEHLWT